MIAELGPTEIGAYAAGAAIAVATFVQSFRGKMAAKATKVVVEDAIANPAVTKEVLATVLATVLAKVQEMTANLATKDAVDMFSARQDAFRLTIMGEIGKLSESGRQLSEQFPTFKKELTDKVNAAVAELHTKIDAVDAKIPTPVVPAEPIAG